MHQPLAASGRRRRHRLLDLDDEFAPPRIVRGGHGQGWAFRPDGTTARIAEVAARYVLEDLQEVLDRRRLAVMALEIEVHAFAESLRAEDRADHAHDFGALLVDGRRVEVVDLAVAARPHRMRERPLVLGELVRAQRTHLGDALDRPRALVGGEFVVAEDSQPFLQAELEPVAACDPVAGPVVEIFMRDDRPGHAARQLLRRFPSSSRSSRFSGFA